MKIKVSVSGAYSSGKTTLSRQIPLYVPNSILLSEHSWEVKNLFPDINWSSQIVRDYMLFSQLVREKEIEQAQENIVVCDSGILEAIAHSLVFGLDTRMDLIDQLHHRKYDIVFLCDYRNVPIVDNQVRETDPDLRVNLHNALIQVAQQLGYEPIALIGDPNHRLQETLTQIMES